jgi:hypothetical protein
MVQRETKWRLIIIFFYVKGTAYCKFIPQGQTANQAPYVETLKRLHEAIGRKRPELWPNDWILHQQFLAQKSITEMEHPPYSSDLAPNDFWMFRKIKSA